MGSLATLFTVVATNVILLLTQGVMRLCGSTSNAPYYIGCGITIIGGITFLALEEKIRKYDKKQPFESEEEKEIRLAKYRAELEKREEHARYYARTGKLPDGLELTKRERRDYKGNLNTYITYEEERAIRYRKNQLRFEKQLEKQLHETGSDAREM